MEELLRQLVEELDRVHVVAESDRLFELVEKARTLLGAIAPPPKMCDASCVTCEDVKEKGVVWDVPKGWKTANLRLEDWTHPGVGKSSYVQPGE